ncbi:centractin- actin- protein of the dynactin complex [Lodderomyces elongisporus]|uniref:centractin- actin- protein of the dynactin complex n=1 Tax=Lodderomyces elongisporus TaxID=36914 RepID=UPI00291F6719|nr:centractin- actin- protein of the dynactin complex [Lodderomyces elongisporus]WLF80873.1 centractin- actin- protein of the dynactin complex [Lodderomyces elongisporus]
MDETLYNQPVVVDNGSGTLKAGFAGEEKPRTYASSIIGRPKYQKLMAGSLTSSTSGSTIASDTDLFVGDAAQKNRGLLRLNYPVEHGIVTKWSDMEIIWDHMFTQDLKIKPEDHPLLITEAPLNPRSNREKMCQVMFEQFNVPCMYISIQAVLALYASGRTTGVVVDSGDGVSHIVPVYEGFALPPSIQRMDVAGRDVTSHLSYNIRRMTGVALQSSAELEVVRSMKESCCFISKDPVRDEKLYRAHYLRKSSHANNELFSTYKLPDGHEVHLGVERFRAPEILFNPQLIGTEYSGLHDLVSRAIAKNDLDLRPILYQNILLSGGNTLIKNFGDRLLKELKDLQDQNKDASASIWNKSITDDAYSTKMKIKIFAPPERKYSTWIGGSILAGLSTFKKMWVSSEEYKDDPDIIFRKCL